MTKETKRVITNMKIVFEEDDRNGYIEYYAVSYLAIYGRKVHDELLWAEIRRYCDGRWRVLWEDDWQNPFFVGSLFEAKEHILTNYHRHSPHINGKSFNIEEL